MKRMRKAGHFFAVLLFNMLVNIKWTIPAWILLLCHFLFDWSVWWFCLALVIWLLGILLWMNVIGKLIHLGNIPDPPKKNKNPYSKKNTISSDSDPSNSDTHKPEE